MSVVTEEHCEYFTTRIPLENRSRPIFRELIATEDDDKFFASHFTLNWIAECSLPQWGSSQRSRDEKLRAGLSAVRGQRENHKRLNCRVSNINREMQRISDVVHAWAICVHYRSFSTSLATPLAPPPVLAFRRWASVFKQNWKGTQGHSRAKTYYTYAEGHQRCQGQGFRPSYVSVGFRRRWH